MGGSGGPQLLQRRLIALAAVPLGVSRRRLQRWQRGGVLLSPGDGSVSLRSVPRRRCGRWADEKPSSHALPPLYCGWTTPPRALCHLFIGIAGGARGRGPARANTLEEAEAITETHSPPAPPAGYWCVDEASCHGRNKTEPAQMSSTSWPPTIEANGIFSTVGASPRQGLPFLPGPLGRAPDPTSLGRAS